MSQDLKVQIGGDSSKLKQAINEAKRDVGGFDKAVKSAGGGMDATLSKGIGQVKEIGSKFAGLGPILGGIAPGLGPIGLAVGAITVAVNYAINQFKDFKQTIKDLNQTYVDGEKPARRYLDAISGDFMKSAEDKAKKSLEEIQAEQKRINEAQNYANNNMADPMDSLIGSALANKQFMKDTAERNKRLNELRDQEAAAIEVLKKAEADRRKAESDAEVKASQEAAKQFQAEEAKKKALWEQISALERANMEEEDRLHVLEDELEHYQKIGREAEAGSVAQLEAAKEVLDLQGKIQAIKTKIADKEKKDGEDQKKKEEELAKLRYDRIWEAATAEQRVKEAEKKYLEARIKAEKDGNTDNLIALEKAKDLVIKTREEAKKGKTEEKKDRPRNSTGQIVSEEDRARTLATLKRNEELRPKGGRITTGKIGDAEKVGSDPQLSQIIDLLTPKE
jgi:hypothetical protein